MLRKMFQVSTGPSFVIIKVSNVSIGQLDQFLSDCHGPEKCINLQIQVKVFATVSQD